MCQPRHEERPVGSRRGGLHVLRCGWPAPGLRYPPGRTLIRVGSKQQTAVAPHRSVRCPGPTKARPPKGRGRAREAGNSGTLSAQAPASPPITSLDARKRPGKRPLPLSRASAAAIDWTRTPVSFAGPHPFVQVRRGHRVPRIRNKGKGARHYSPELEDMGADTLGFASKLGRGNLAGVWVRAEKQQRV